MFQLPRICTEDVFIYVLSKILSGWDTNIDAADRESNNRISSPGPIVSEDEKPSAISVLYESGA